MQPFGVLTRRSVALWIGLLLVVVAALSALAGFAATGWEDFEWDVAAIVGTALGTTALAGFTGALAFTTSGDVRATWELARLTREQQASAERPLVLQYDAGFSGSPKDGYVRVVLYNAGLGSALRVEVSATYFDEAHPAGGTHIVPAIRPEGTAEFQIPIRFQEPYPVGGIRGDGFALSGTYRDRSQRNTYEIITDWSSVADETPPPPMVAFV